MFNRRENEFGSGGYHVRTGVRMWRRVVRLGTSREDMKGQTKWIEESYQQEKPYNPGGQDLFGHSVDAGEGSGEG